MLAGLTIKSGYRFPHCLKDYLDPRYYIAWIRHASQRVSRGYADRDLWSLDYYLARVLVNALPYYKNSNPAMHVLNFLDGDDGGWNGWADDAAEQAALDRWDAMIDDVVSVLTRYYGGEDPQFHYSTTGHDELVRVMRLVAENFGAFWD